MGSGTSTNMAYHCPPLRCFCLCSSLSRYVRTSTLTLVVLLSYFKSVQWANRFNIAHATITISVSVFLIIMWAISIGIFNYHDQSATPDLWSRACHQRDAGIPNGAVNWGQYCIEQ